MKVAMTLVFPIFICTHIFKVLSLSVFSCLPYLFSCQTFYKYNCSKLFIAQCTTYKMYTQFTTNIVLLTPILIECAIRETLLLKFYHDFVLCHLVYRTIEFFFTFLHLCVDKQTVYLN